MKRRNDSDVVSLPTHFACAALTYVLAAAASRDWFFHWGATLDEEHERLPGDDVAGAITSTRAITIHAPVEEVWKWLVQIGQDRAGFYSYDRMERLVLADIHNADRIVPEWQELSAGDSVRLASKRVYGDLPLLRVLAIEPNHYLVIEHWGAFIVRPVDDHTTRMIFRSHADERSLLKKCADFLFFDPLHFVMERRMMIGIKERAENQATSLSNQLSTSCSRTTSPTTMSAGAVTPPSAT